MSGVVCVVSPFADVDNVVEMETDSNTLKRGSDEEEDFSVRGEEGWECRDRFVLRYDPKLLRFKEVLGKDDNDCFYYHSWRNNIVIAFGTLSSFLT